MTPLLLFEYAFCIYFIGFIIYSILLVLLSDFNVNPNDFLGKVIYYNGLFWIFATPVIFITIIVRSLRWV